MKDYTVIRNYADSINKIKFLPHTQDEKGYVYICELDDNRIKAGTTANIYTRLYAHNTHLQKYAGLSMKRFAIIGIFERGAAAENQLLRLLKRPEYKCSLLHGQEWFQGKFDDAIPAISKITSPIFQSHLSLRDRYVMSVEKISGTGSMFDYSI